MLASFLKRDLRNLFRKDASPNFQAQNGLLSLRSRWRSVRSLSNVDLQPHRTRSWKTPRLDARFQKRAEQVLWCYGNAARLAEQGIWVVCVDEIPTFQILERDPIRRAIPGSIEQQQFDYTRHGTVNMLVFLVVHTGLMKLIFRTKNDHEHYLPELELLYAFTPWSTIVRRRNFRACESVTLLHVSWTFDGANRGVAGRAH